MSHLYDERTDCFSVMQTATVREYLDLVTAAHAARGRMSGQRETLKTTSAKRIRDRMVSDIRHGAVLPPVVLGVIVSEEKFSRLQEDLKSRSLEEILSGDEFENISIIDGMQRTAALSEASQIEPDVLNREMRVEFWVSSKIQNLIYRMLVLNTGQVPWTLSRQLSVVYAPLLRDINNAVDGIGRVFTPDEPGRRVQAGEFSADSLVELYISFSLRKTGVDTREALSDEFSKLDFVENLSHDEFQIQFYQALGVLTRMDRSFSRFDSGAKTKLSKGRNVFDSQPARIGLVVSIAQYVIGRPGMERAETDKKNRMAKIVAGSDEFCARLDSMSIKDLGVFLKLDVLSETLDKRVGQVGRFERGVYFDAFSVLIQEDFSVPSMEPCWRAN